MVGRCHICWAETEIAYCKLCKHWFCEKCRGKWTDRMFGVINNILTPRKNCCGLKNKELQFKLEQNEFKENQ